MSSTSFPEMPCPIARTPAPVGERWSLLILRDAFRGIRRFADFERSLGIARNILSARPRTPVGQGVLERRRSTEDAREIECRLTRRGRELAPVLIARSQCGRRWAFRGEPPMRIVNRRSGAELEAFALRDADGEKVSLRDLELDWRSRPGSRGRG